MAYRNVTLGEFADMTWSKEPAPGGGGVSAAVASLGAALAGMVSNFTTGKKKYAEHEEDIRRIIDESEVLKDRFLELIDRDEENFVPLSKAYSMKDETDEEKARKKEVISECSVKACEAVMEVMRLCRDCANIHAELLEKGSVMLVSDVGVGCELILAASRSAYLNILINLGAIADRKLAESIDSEYSAIMKETVSVCRRTYQKVVERLV